MPLQSLWNRRTFLSLSGAAGVGLAAARKMIAAPLLLAGRGQEPHSADTGYAAWPNGAEDRPVAVTGFGSTGDVYAELGVTPLINGRGTLTDMGGSLLPPEVTALMRMGSNHFCRIDELERAAGNKLAAMLKLPAGNSGLVTCGAAAAILSGYAGMLARDNPLWIRQLPDLTGIEKYEVIIQKSHRYAFDHQIRQTGCKLVEVETREQCLNAIGPHTLAMHFTNLFDRRGQIERREFVRIAHDHNLWAFNDAAADTPPVERLWEYVHMGYDLVAFSGGKDIRGPQCAGLLLGKQQLLDWAQQNMSPQEDTIARPCKVGKEEIFGMLKAVELFLASDQQAILQSYYARLGVISTAVKQFPGVSTAYRFNPDQIANHTVSMTIRWDPAKLPINAKQVADQLIATRPTAIYLNMPGVVQLLEPGVWAADYGQRPNTYSLGVSCWQLKPGEEAIIADRLTEIFRAAAA